MPIAGTEAVLGAAIATAVVSNRPDETMPVSNAELTAIWTAISKEIIDQFVAEATIVGTVTSGAGAGGAIDGTIT